MIAALLGQKLPPFEAAQLGVYVHGLAGDIARDQNGEVGMIAATSSTPSPTRSIHTSQEPEQRPREVMGIVAIGQIREDGVR